MLYMYNGAFTYTDVMQMPVADRKWFIERMKKQKEYEEQLLEQEKAGRKSS